jgi:hypothetical protein
MSLVAGRGPLSKDPAGWFSPPLPEMLSSSNRTPAVCKLFSATGR